MTIEGRGDIGSFLQEHGVDRPDRTYFVSGVSNSQETRESEYQREKDLLLQQDRDKRLVYVSSLSVFYGDTRYTQHKREMEELIKEEFSQWTILRLGNLLHGENPHTIVNFFRNKIETGESFEVKDEYRYLVGTEEFLHWIDMIPQGWNCEMNVPGEMIKVPEIVNRIKEGKL